MVCNPLRLALLLGCFAIVHTHAARCTLPPFSFDDVQVATAAAYGYLFVPDEKMKRNQRKRRRVKDFWDHSANLTDKEFKRFYRVTRARFMWLLAPRSSENATLAA